MSGTTPQVGSLTGDVSASGARIFSGLSYAFRSTGDPDMDVLCGRFGWGLSLLFRLPGTIANGTLIEYGAFGGSVVADTAFSIRFLAAGQIQIGCRRGGTYGAVITYTLPVGFSLSAVHQLGLSVRPLPYSLAETEWTLFVDGTAVQRAYSLRQTEDSGSANRWVIGGSFDRGISASTPSDLCSVTVDDVALVRDQCPDVAWHRSIFTRATAIDFDSKYLRSDARSTAAYTRVLIKVPQDAFVALSRIDLDWVDLSTIADVDFVRKVEVSDEIDSLMAQAKVELLPRYGLWNLSPFVTSADDGTGVPLVSTSEGIGIASELDQHLLRFNRRIRVESCNVPCGMSRSQATPYYEPIFDGFIRDVSPGLDSVQLNCLDLGAALLAWIEPTSTGTDRLYGSPTGSPLLVELQKMVDQGAPNAIDLISYENGGTFGANLANDGTVSVKVLSYLYSADSNSRGRPHALVVGDQFVLRGVIAAPAGINDTVFTVESVGAINDTSGIAKSLLITTPAGEGPTGLGAAGYEGGTLYAVDALSYLDVGTPRVHIEGPNPANAFEWSEPASKAVLTALDDVSQALCTWRCRYRWSDALMAYRLTLFSPAAASTASVETIDDVVGLGGISTDGERMRNVVHVEVAPTEFYDPATNTLVPQPGVERLVLAAPAVDAASVRRYGRLYARARYGGDTYINSLAEARNLALQMISDLSTPAVEVTFDCLASIHLDLGDAVTIQENLTNQLGVQFSGTRTGTITEVAHVFEVTGCVTQITMQGVRSGTSVAAAPATREGHSWSFQGKGGVTARPLSAGRRPLASQIVAERLTPTTISVRWPMPSRDRSRLHRYTEVYASTVDGFVPGPSTLRTIAQGDLAIIPNLSSSTLYIQIRHVDREGNYSAFSGQASKGA